MKTKWIIIFTAIMLVFSATSAWAAPSTSKRSGSFSTGKSNSTYSGSTKSGGSSGSSGFSGGASNKSTVPSTSSKGGSTYTTGATKGTATNPYTGKSYYGGSTYTNAVPNGYRSSSIWPTVGAFAAGSFLGSMLHPWGGYYPAYGGGYVHQPFSMMSMLLDLVLLGFILWVVMRVVRSFRRGYR